MINGRGCRDDEAEFGKHRAVLRSTFRYTEGEEIRDGMCFLDIRG